MTQITYGTACSDFVTRSVLSRRYGYDRTTNRREWLHLDDKSFLTLWKDADPDIPILKQAKAEYAKLQ